MLLPGLALGLRLICVSQAAPEPLAHWTFDRPGDLQGWQPNGDLSNVVVTNGALSCRAVGPDPILELRPLLNLPASPWQAVEIRLKADRDGTAELFWSNTSAGRYGGFTQEKTTRFNVRGDGAWHTYALLPFWHREGRIVRLRFDVYDGARFEIASLRVLDLVAKPTREAAAFDFKRGADGWQWFTPVSDRWLGGAPTGGRVTACGHGLLLSPPVKIDTAPNSYISVRMSVNAGHHATLFFATDQSNGLQQHAFPLQVDGHDHTYNLDMLQAPGWRGTVLALGLQPSNDTNAVAIISRLKAGNEPEGPPQLAVVSFAIGQALPRVGLPVTINAVLSNRGAAVATNLVAEIELPPGLRLGQGSKATQEIPRLGFDEEKALAWEVRADKPFEASVRLQAGAANAEPVTAAAPARFSPRLAISQAGYVPQPKPVRGPYEVGAYYFPGWKTASQWEPLRRFPERKPVLGWYREGEPEVADWHIKWAVEHGITFFAYDWYWSRGSRQLEHALHDGYFHARYRNLLKFCLLWANHNPPGSSSADDCVAVTRYWIENYFRRPEYLAFDRKPIVIIFAPDRLREDLGIEGTRKAFELMRAECKAAGLNGLCLVACVGDVGGARRAAQEGYDAVSAYNWPGLGMTGEGMFAPYETLLQGYGKAWAHLLEESPLPLAPLPVSGGWDSRPWHGENNLVRFGRTPESFKRHLLDARRVLNSLTNSVPVPKAILVEAWNEWGEGSYIEPQAEYGFGYLDAIRETFTDAPTEHADITPADAGLGPYELTFPERSLTSWDFSKMTENPWDNTMQLERLKVADGVLSARTTGNDPAFFGPGIRISASDYRAVGVRMRLSRATGPTGEDLGQLFWRTSRLPESESTSERFPVKIDGSWHDCLIPVAGNARWRGTITRLRLDPATQADIEVAISRIWLEK